MTIGEQNTLHTIATCLPKLVKELETANKLRAIELTTRHPNNPIVQNILKNILTTPRKNDILGANKTSTNQR